MIMLIKVTSSVISQCVCESSQLHPESPERLQFLLARLRDAGLLQDCLQVLCHALIKDPASVSVSISVSVSLSMSVSLIFPDIDYLPRSR